ncbi:MAG: choice-of-anchor Q domain-containing protein [Dokdonella sp.]|uniref:choice-of-anchor Q domain-containing protein n=1 Tax=Dokdonella sp. TaxID=2291710 RepID=UPI0032633A8F
MFQSPSALLRPTPLAAALVCALATSAVAFATAAAADTGHASRAYALRMGTRQARVSGHTARATHAPTSPHATLPVTSCLDDADPGTLRNVIAGAVEGDVVDLSALTCSTITLTEGPIDTSALGDHQLYDVTVQGPGRDALTIDAAGASQVFVVGGFSSEKGTFTANDLTIANGTYSGSLAACVEGFGGTVALNRVAVTNCRSSGTYHVVFGGAVDVTTLEMTDSTITNSSIVATGAHSTAIGGGAYASDGATLVRSTISGNTVTAPYASDGGYTSAGGGLYSRGDLSLTDSTISGNSIETTNAGEDADGGGIYVRGIATISSSTIDGNTADGNGGGIFKAIYSVYGEPGGSNPTTLLTLTDSTVANNNATRGGGIGTSRPLHLYNSTIADNQATEGGAGVMFVLSGITDSSGVLIAQSAIDANNTVDPAGTLAADLAADDAVTVTGANNLVMAADPAIVLPADTLNSDPLLLPLADNGGPTRTLALGAGSPAIDAGNNVQELANDQRGAAFARVGGPAADIGAFEVQQPTAPTDVIFADGFDGEPTTPATYAYSYDDGDGDTNQGPPSTFDPDMLWGNYYMAQPGGQFVTHLSVAFGPTFPSLANGAVTFWLLQDDDADDDPTNAHVIGSVQATPDVFNDTFYEVAISPTYVHGGFFVGASAKLLGGQDRPARVDTNASGHDSWFFYAPDIGATINDLASAPFGTRNDNPAYVVLPGAFMVRATGEAELP